MKRSSLRRKKGTLKRGGPRRRVATPRWKLEELARQLFREAARRQRVWRAPGCKTRARPHAHHVLYEQHARAEGANPHDPRNAMPVCPHCHYAHHHRVEGHVIPAGALPAAALEFMREVLGAERAAAYLERYYS